MKIEVMRGEEAGRIWSIDEPGVYEIGRDPACALRLNDAEASREHARISFGPDGVRLEDLHSRNGTFLNESRVESVALLHGDQVRIGQTVLRVVEAPMGDAAQGTHLEMDAIGRTVVMSLPHQQADLLTGKISTDSIAEMSHENTVLREICRISQVVAAETEPEKVMTSVLDRLQEILGADTACVLNWSEDDSDWRIGWASSAAGQLDSIQVSRTIVNAAHQDGNAILCADVSADERFSASTSIMSQHISSALCSPLKIGGRFKGVLFIDRRNMGKAFDGMDLRLAASVGNILGLFLEKQEYEAETRKTARLAVIGEVVAGLAHYIKNIVTGFRLSIQGLQTAVERDRMEHVRSFLKSIADQERRISQLMLNMLTYVKDRKPERTQVQLAELIESVVGPYRPQLEERGVALDVDVPASVPPVHGEEPALHRVLLNLLTNAMDSFRGEGDRAKRIMIVADSVGEGRQVQIRVRDTGAGIPADKVANIFDAFYSTKGSGGTGLGLAVVSKIVAEHGGTVSVKSKEHEWTEFTLQFPASPVAGTAGS